MKFSREESVDMHFLKKKQSKETKVRKRFKFFSAHFATEVNSTYSANSSRGSVIYDEREQNNCFITWIYTI